MLNNNPKRLAFELKQRINKCEKVIENQRGPLIKECLKWCKQKQYELSRFI